MKQSEKREPRLKVFSERFELLRKERNLSNTDFAKFLGMSRQTVGFYLNGERVPDALTLIKIAEKCNVSADWLLGLSDVTTTTGDIKQACNLTGLSQEAVECLICLCHFDALRKEPALGLVNEVIFSASIFTDCLFRSALADIKATNALMYMTPDERKSYWAKKDLEFVNDAFEHNANVCSVEVSAAEASLLFEIQAIENVKGAAEVVFDEHKDRIRKAVLEEQYNEE